MHVSVITEHKTLNDTFWDRYLAFWLSCLEHLKLRKTSKRGNNDVTYKMVYMYKYITGMSVWWQKYVTYKRVYMYKYITGMSVWWQKYVTYKMVYMYKYLTGMSVWWQKYDTIRLKKHWKDYWRQHSKGRVHSITIVPVYRWTYILKK